MTVSRSDRVFVVLPDPGRAGTLDEFTQQLRLLKVWAGDPSYGTVTDRINTAWKTAGRPDGEWARRATVADCFRPGRRRLNTDLVVAVVQALHPDQGYVAQWRQALQVIGGQTRAASQVQVQDSLPQELAEFTGRSAELDRLRQALRHGETDDGTVICTIAGMAGVGKTQLAIRAGHELAREQPFDRVLFVNLRGFHPDPAQPPADPAAVLEGFLRLLGVPGHQIPHDRQARTAAYRRCLAGSRTLVVLDNAADADQVRPLLPETAGCPVLVTSRRSLTTLRPAMQLAVQVFTPDEAVAFLGRRAVGVPIGEDPDAAGRIAHRCGHLPLALSLVTAHVLGTPGWTLTDHADRLDERHHNGRLDTGVGLALDLSYQHLPTDRKRLLRLASLHPGQDLDAHAAAALADTDLPTAQTLLHHLCRDHLLQQPNPGRYTLHDLTRAYATDRAGDEDPPPDRRAALTRLFDYYLATTAAAMDTLYPAEAHRRPRAAGPRTPVPALADPDSARGWLDTERPALVAVAAHAVTHGWPAHTVRLSATLFRYLNGGYLADALTIHGHAHHAAQQIGGDLNGQAQALASLGATYTQLGQNRSAAEHFQQALHLYRQAGDQAGEARALTNLGVAQIALGRSRPAVDHFAQALALFQQAGHRAGEAHSLTNLGDLEGRLGRHGAAGEHFQQALALFRRLGDLTGEAWTLNCLGEFEVRLGRYGAASDHLQQALALYRQLGDRVGEAWALNNLATLHTCLGQATEQHQQALAIFRETGEQGGEASALNSLGEAAGTIGDHADALAHHTAAHTIAADIGDPDQRARAHTGLGHAHHALANPGRARHHYQHALTLYTDLERPNAEQIRALLTTIDLSPEQHRAELPISTEPRR